VGHADRIEGNYDKTGRTAAGPEPR
jgi:hypothetical protein